VEQQDLIPDADAKPATCECYRDLPLDTDHGPYPGVVYIHGLGSFRIAALTSMQQWASRGFIVVAADHPGDFLTDYLASSGLGCSTSGQVDPGDMQTEGTGEVAALVAEGGDFAFLGDRLDKTRLAISGHSMGGQATADIAGNIDNVQVAMTFAPLGGGALSGSGNLKSAIQITGTADGVTGYSKTWYGVAQTPIKRHIGITNGGHIDVSDLCRDKNDMGLRSIDVANKYGVCGAAVISGLAQCGDDPTSEQQAPDILKYATTAVLEETLHCQDRSAAFDMLQTKFSAVGEFLHTP
jgi:dienelactone hydrolase